MEKIKISLLKKGSPFRLFPGGPIFVRDHYDRSSKKCAYHLFKDLNCEFFTHGSRLVYPVC